MGIFDQDVDDKVSLAVPQLFMRGIEQKEWSEWKFWYVRHRKKDKKKKKKKKTNLF